MKTWSKEREFPIFFKHLNFAGVEFSEDTRHQVRSCSTLPQVLDNEIDSVKSAPPVGKQS